jgi:hypothetical protein
MPGLDMYIMVALNKSNALLGYVTTVRNGFETIQYLPRKRLPVLS